MGLGGAVVAGVATGVAAGVASALMSTRSWRPASLAGVGCQPGFLERNQQGIPAELAGIVFDQDGQHAESLHINTKQSRLRHNNDEIQYYEHE